MADLESVTTRHPSRAEPPPESLGGGSGGSSPRLCPECGKALSPYLGTGRHAQRHTKCRIRKAVRNFRQRYPEKAAGWQLTSRARRSVATVPWYADLAPQLWSGRRSRQHRWAWERLETITVRLALDGQVLSVRMALRALVGEFERRNRQRLRRNPEATEITLRIRALELALGHLDPRMSARLAHDLFTVRSARGEPLAAAEALAHEINATLRYLPGRPTDGLFVKYEDYLAAYHSRFCAEESSYLKHIGHRLRVIGSAGHHPHAALGMTEHWLIREADESNWPPLIFETNLTKVELLARTGDVSEARKLWEGLEDFSGIPETHFRETKILKAAIYVSLADHQDAAELAAEYFRRTELQDNTFHVGVHRDLAAKGCRVLPHVPEATYHCPGLVPWMLKQGARRGGWSPLVKE